MSSLSFFPLIPAVTTASAAPVYHGGMIPCLGDVEPVNTRWLIEGYDGCCVGRGRSRRRGQGRIHGGCGGCRNDRTSHDALP